LLMSGGEVDTKDDIDIAGYHVSTPAIDIHTIGAGGGTIAGVDSAGLLYVGPEGAGADPGPACYRRGGTRPTVTDAQLVLGRLRPGKSAGGTLDLDLDAATAAIDEHVAEPLGMTTEQAAAGIVELVEQHLLSAVEHISIERGHSPRRFTLVAAGGAGPMHGAAVADGLGCSRVYVPRDAGALCAIGMLHADVRQDFTKVVIGPLADLPEGQLDNEFAELRAQASEVMTKEGFDSADVELTHELELHHPGQLWSIRVGVPDGIIDIDTARAGFEAEYERLYGHVQQDGTIMVASLRLTARGSTGEVAVSGGEPATDELEPIDTRSVWHGEQGWIDTPIYDGAFLRPGHRLPGPALVEELTTTVVTRPGDELWVDENGDFFVACRSTVSPPAGQAEPSTAPGAAAASTYGSDEASSPTVGTAAPGGSEDGSAFVAGTGIVQRQTQLDPIVLALMQNRLDQITRHMGWVMTRTARSTIFSQSHDFSCYITTPDGTLVANADGIPIHTGGGGFAVRALLGRFGDRMAPDDEFLLSDP
ncbi:MAG: hydantoinase/oxoprolinase family protein, partial [Actinomycetota bacterium]|nr:hydantoinase/oxoprolinase family protein [Actinomycetota bacterium]